MRLALFSDTYLPQTNGVARTLHRLTGHLHRRGIEHLLFTPTSVSEENCDDPVRKISSIPFFLYPECRLALPGLSSIQNELRSFRPDLLHMATPFNLGLSGLRYAQKHNLPHIASYHTHFDRYLGYYRMRGLIPLYWKYMKWFHRTCDAVLAPSQETAGVLRAHGFSGLRQWSRGVDCGLYDPAKRSSEVRDHFGIKAPLLLLYVGRVAPEKISPPSWRPCACCRIPLPMPSICWWWAMGRFCRSCGLTPPQCQLRRQPARRGAGRAVCLRRPVRVSVQYGNLRQCRAGGHGLRPAGNRRRCRRPGRAGSARPERAAASAAAARRDGRSHLPADTAAGAAAGDGPGGPAAGAQPLVG